MKPNILIHLEKLHNVSKQYDINDMIIQILKDFFNLQSFTFLNYNSSTYSYQIVFSTVLLENSDDIYFFDAEIEIEPPYELSFEDKDIEVYTNLKLETEDTKYCFLVHEKKEFDKELLLSLLMHYLTANKNKILLQYYQNNLITSQYQLDILNEIGDLLGNFNLDIVLTKLLENANNIVSGDVGIIFIYDKKEEALKPKVNWGVKEDIAFNIINLDTQKPIVYEVFESKEMRFFENIQELKKISYPSDKVYLHSLLALPIFTNNENLGVLVLLNFELDESFIDVKLVTLETLVKLASVGIENSIFFQKSLEQEKVNTQLKIASDIQNNLLPSQDLLYENILITGSSKPAMNIGGDFYNYLVQDNKIYAFLGDVAGKGIPAALLTTMAMIVIKTSISKDLPLEKIVNNINNIIAEESLGENYLTLGIFEINLDTEKARIVNGGHTEILLYKKNENKIYEFSSSNLPVGMFENIDYKYDDIFIEKGDIIITFSDGIPDAINDKEETYGLETLKKIVYDNNEMDLVELKKKILNDIKEFSKGATQFDDLTILMIKKL